MSVLGNDVVDLRHPRCAGKTRDRRFMERVFTPEEAHAIEDAEEPEQAIWIVWASKEAAFKVVSKILGDPPPFRHSQFQFQRHPSTAPVEGSVTFEGTEIPVRIEVLPERVHALAWHPESAADGIHSEVKLLPDLEQPPGPRWEESLRPRFTDVEWRSIHRPDSALVRLKARRHLSRILGVDETVIEIVCDEGPPGQMPPKVLVEGREWTGDLSLSHHGRFLAWAFAETTHQHGTPTS